MDSSIGTWRSARAASIMESTPPENNIPSRLLPFSLIFHKIIGRVSHSKKSIYH